MFSKYDCAFLKSDAGDEPYVVRIEDSEDEDKEEEDGDGGHHDVYENP